MLDDYNYFDDPILKRFLHENDRLSLHNMFFYDYDGAQFGKQLMAHQNRVSKNGAEFLLFLGYSQRAAANFRAAMLFHDIGKTHHLYHSEIWSLPDRPTDEQKALQKKHAAIGADMLIEITQKNVELKTHPHIEIRYNVTKFHHERLDGTGPEKVNVRTLPEYIQVACIADAYDGDRIQRPHQPKQRTPKEALKRLAGIEDPKHKYKGAFCPDLLKKYIDMMTRKYGISMA